MDLDSATWLVEKGKFYISHESQHLEQPRLKSFLKSQISNQFPDFPAIYYICIKDQKQPQDAFSCF